MSALVRVWIALAAIGAALCHLSLVFDSPPVVTVVLATLALAEFGWGVITFARSTIPLPRIAILVGVLPTLVWVALLVVAPAASPRFLPMVTASLLGLAVAVVLAVRVRTGADADGGSAGSPPRGDSAAPSDGARRHPSPALHAVGVVAGVLVIGAIVTPALAASGLYLPTPDRPAPTISHHG